MKGWRTITFNLATAVVAFAAAALPFFGQIGLPMIFWQVVILGNALGNVALRFVTDTPVGQASPPAAPEPRA